MKTTSIAERFEALIKVLKHDNASGFAAEIGTSTTVIYNILNARNEPSMQIIRKIKERYPQVNLDWLIIGNGKPLSSEALDNIAENDRLKKKVDAMEQMLTEIQKKLEKPSKKKA